MRETNPKMAVVYRASTASNVGADDSKIAYKHFFGDCQHLDFSVYRLKNNTFKVTTLCLGLLCVLLLAVVIGQSVFYHSKNQEHHISLKALTNDKEIMQQNLRTTLSAKKATETQRDDLQRQYDYTVKLKNQINTNNIILTEQMATLKAAKGQLETSNAALIKELEETKKLKDEVASNSNALNTAKQLLQNQYDTVVRHGKELQQNYNAMIKERDNLLNKFNNVTRSREQLQLTYNNLITEIEKLQDNYYVISSEKDRFESNHHNLTIHMDTLKATCNMVKKAEDELRGSYESLVKEKNEIESRLSEVTAERDLLRVKSDNMTVQINHLQEEFQKLNATIQVTQKQCPSNWKKFQNSCYYKSFSKKTWGSSRQYCKNKDADLVTIASQEEMEFINKLYTGNTEVWIGLSDSGVEGEWKWVDGSNLTLSFWGKDQPNSHNGRNQDCVEIWHQSAGIGEWNDESCTVEQYFLCEM